MGLRVPVLATGETWYSGRATEKTECLITATGRTHTVYMCTNMYEYIYKDTYLCIYMQSMETSDVYPRVLREQPDGVVKTPSILIEKSSQSGEVLVTGKRETSLPLLKR